MVRTGEIRVRSRGRNSARAAISRRDLLAPGLAVPAEKRCRMTLIDLCGMLRSRSALQRASDKNMVLFGSPADPDHASIEGPGVRPSGLA